MGQDRPIRIGRIDYANAWPLFHDLERHASGIKLEIVSRVPSELNRMLGAGELDAAAVSSFAYGLGWNDYLLLPELSVGSVGKVHSILLFLKEPLERKLPGRIALTTTSATSVNLLKIIMAKRFQCVPEYVSAEPKLDEMLAVADAALLIGDPAIEASWRDHGLHVLDLGEMWNDWTGLGMAYAVVAARRESVLREPEAFRSLLGAFKTTRAHNVEHRDKLSELACGMLGGTPAYWDQYFGSLRYGFDDRLKKGLALYFQYARELDLLPHEVQLAFLEEQSLLKVNE